MAGVQVLLAAHKPWSANFLPAPKKQPAKLGAHLRLGSAFQDESFISFSPEAQKKLEEQQEAEREKIRKAIEEKQEKTARLKELDKNTKLSAIYHRIGELKALLKTLVERMRGALIFGDKRAAALIAKEAAQIAKELASLFKAAGSAEQAETISKPQDDPANESEKLANTGESDETISNEEIERAEKVSPQGSFNAKAEETQDDEKNDAQEMEEQNLANKLLEYAKELKAQINQMVSKHMTENAKNGSQLEKEKAEIIALLRTIIYMAKGTIKQKSPIANSPPDGLHETSVIEKDVAKAETDIEDAIGEIADAIGQLAA
jgi:hypothetical protein